MTATTRELMDLAARQFQVDPATLKPEDDFFATLKISSIQALELLSELEMHFDVEIPDYELQGVVTFAALSALNDQRI